MKLHTNLLVAIAAAMVVPVMFTACGGPECGTGTTEKDGECVPTAAPVTCDSDTELSEGKCVSTVTAVTCEAGTSLEEGKCVLSAAGCGAGTSLDDGECVADDSDLSQACGDGTTFDSAAGACVADSSVTCGPNTIAEDGSCVPDPATVCAAGTLANDMGVCVVDAAACGDNTILDPNTNTCLVNDAGVFCGANTAYDAASETCAPTGDVCDMGTTFDDVSGLCLPDSTCQMGDVILNGVCVSPAEEAFANADVTSTETADRVANNDDTNLGGTATPLTIPAMGTEYRAAGQINVPFDLDGDGAVDQDVDSYTITGTTGQTFKIAVQPLKGPSLGFIVRNDDNSYVRLSTQGLTPGAARQIVLPADGTYTVDVISSIAITGPSAPVGADDWDYVLSLEEIAGPVATDVDASMGPVTGDFANLSDNLFRLTNLTAGELVSFTVDNIGGDVGTGYMQVWASPTELLNTYEIEAGDVVNAALPIGDAYVLFDWGFVSGPDTGFEVTAAPLANQENLGTIAAGGTVNSGLVTQVDGDVRYISFTLEAGEIAEISHTNTENSTVDMVVRGASGQVFSDTSFSATGATTPEFAYIYSPDGGTYIIESEANGDRTDSGFDITSITPADAGSFDTGDQIASTDAAALQQNKRKFLKLTLLNDVSAAGSLFGGGGETTADFSIIDAVTGDLLVDVTSDTDAIALALLPAGDHIVEIQATGADLATGYVLALDLAVPPISEVEPNDDLATAQALTIPFDVIGTGGYATNGDEEFTAADVPFDFYTFDLAQDLGPNEVLSLALANTAAIQASGAPTFTLHDSMGVPITFEDIGNTLEVPGLTAGTYYVTIAVSFITSFDTAYRLTGDIVSFPLEDLGAIALAASSSMSTDLLDEEKKIVSFSLAAGEIAEVVHTNTENEDASISLIGPDVSISDSVFQPQGATSPERAYAYSPNGGTYNLLMEASADTTASVVTVTGISTVALGPKALGDSLDAVQANVVAREAREFYSFSLTENATLSGALTSNGTNAADLFVYDAVTGALVQSVTSGKDAIAINLLTGSYLMAVEADGSELDTGYSATFTLTTPPTLLDGTIGDSCATAIPVNMSGTYTGDLANFTATETGRPCIGSTAANGTDVFFEVTVPDGQTLIASVDNGVDFVSYLVAECADIATNTCIDSQDTGNPETVSVANSTGAPVTYRFSFYTYFTTGTGTFDVNIDIQ